MLPGMVDEKLLVNLSFRFMPASVVTSPLMSVADVCSVLSYEARLGASLHQKINKLQVTCPIVWWHCDFDESLIETRMRSTDS